mmetsp:Transcript_33219/g.69196  ORF Transcript_33219/g.69196 Transcript_33219/m.69196 type:complete len:382 (-) Transcript_33219:442-1587(-)
MLRSLVTVAIEPNNSRKTYANQHYYELILFPLNKVSNIHRHFRDFSIVELFNITQVANITFGKKVDSHTFTTETTRSTDTMNVIFTVGGEIKVDYQRNLLDINTTSEQIGRNEDTRRTGTEFAHNDITLSLVHVTVHAGNSEITLLHFFLQPVDLASSVTVNNSLGDGESLVKITQSFQLPFFAFNSNVELLDTFQGQLILLDKDTDGFTHETFRDLQDIQRHGSREQAHLHRFGQELEDVINLILETTRKHLIGLIKEELSNVIKFESTSVDHIKDTSRCSDNNVDTVGKSTNIITDSRTSNASMDSNIHVVSQSQDHLLNLLGQLTGWGQNQRLTLLRITVQLSQSTNGKGGSFTSTGLSLRNQITTKHGRFDSALLDG